MPGSHAGLLFIHKVTLFNGMRLSGSLCWTYWTPKVSQAVSTSAETNKKEAIAMASLRLPIVAAVSCALKGLLLCSCYINYQTATFCCHKQG